MHGNMSSLMYLVFPFVPPPEYLVNRHLNCACCSIDHFESMVALEGAGIVLYFYSVV